MKVKNSAIPYAGYEYQTLHGVYMLAQWLNSPTEYERVCFEADEDEAPQGIDDIVCERTDGKIDYWQVKFTPTPQKDENRFTWKWLLAKSGKTERSRSILKKIGDAISSVPADQLGQVVLLSNKIPDRSMENCLNGKKIDFSKIELETRVQIVQQLGSEQVAHSLFSALDIQHSDGDYQKLKRTIRSELLNHSDDSGIERLLNRASDWAKFRDSPSEGGWIYLNQIREILSSRRPDPIPEFFHITPQYCLPSENFHNDLKGKISSSQGEIITLTGTPGLGKSTYLSFLCQSLEESDIPVVRHHYFLSVNDTTDDRLSPRIVSESLLHQIQSFHAKVGADTSSPESLRTAIKKCAEHYKEQNKPFVVLIDGLDHVWRDNDRDKKPLDQIFRQLLPIVENLVLIVGTQPVDNELLPKLLLHFSPKDDWLSLPEMNGDSILKFLKHHITSGRLYLNCHKDQRNEQVRGSAQKLFEITSGYPLHVIYSCEFLAQNGKALSSREIEQLPPCSDNNIATYYRDLWNELNYKQKDVLHLSSGFQFTWPRSAFSILLKDEVQPTPSIDAVSHLLYEGASGVTPFHESLIVFIRSEPDHEDRIQALLPSVSEWLENKAPQHLRESWLWTSFAMANDTLPLRHGVTRDWVLDRLIEGCPTRTCNRLLSEAERYAFSEFNFAEAYKHRSLKTRIINGVEFQTWDAPSLKIFSLVYASECLLTEEISHQNEYPPEKLAILAIALWHREDFDNSKLIARKAISRYQTKTKLLSHRNRQDEEAEAALIIKAGVLTDTLNLDGIFGEDNFKNWPESYVSAFIDACLLKKDFSLMVRARVNMDEGPTSIDIELAAIRTSILEEAEIAARPGYEEFTSSALSSFHKILLEGNFSELDTYFTDIDSCIPIKIDNADSYRQWFFYSLNIRLKAAGDFCWLPVVASRERVDISPHLNLIYELVDEVARKLIFDGVLEFEFMCSLIPNETILDDVEWSTRRADIWFKRDWVEISADCHLLTTQGKIEFEALKAVMENKTYRTEWIRLWYKSIHLNVISDKAAQYLIDTESSRQSHQLEETIEYSNSCLELTEFALRHQDKERFLNHLRTCWDYVLGYGHHKDTTIFDVLTGINYLSAVRPEEALGLLERISPIIHNISTFTDGDETRHSKHSISSIIASLNPQTAASIYEQEIQDGEWYYAEETLTALVKNADFTSPIIRSLYLTGLHNSCHTLLREKINSGCELSADLSKEIVDTFGIDILEDIHDDKQPDSLAEKIDLDPADYPPVNIDQLLAALKGKYSTNDFWQKWYTHWEDIDEVDLFENLIQNLPNQTDRLDDRRHLFDRLFVTQKKLYGKKKAFGLLAAGHCVMSGWSHWYESEEKSLERLRIVATTYPSRINEFIVATTVEPDTWKDKFGKLIIPDDRLVFLLSESGRTDEALELSIAMVECLEESLRNLPLQKPKWDWGNGDSADTILCKALVSRLKFPVPSVKLWVIDQISHLLAEPFPVIEKLVLEDLSSRPQESECVEVLSLILASKHHGYRPPEAIGQNIHARSILSDMIIKNLVPNATIFGEYAFEVSAELDLTAGNHKFEQYQGSHVPHVYHSMLQKEQDRTGIPFTVYYRSEWNKTFHYCSETGSGIEYFFSTDRQRCTGQFYTSASHRGRSAYLRTIEIARQAFDMPDGYAEQLATPALPIEPVYFGSHDKRSDFIPSWDGEAKPNKDNVVDFVKNCINNFHSVNDSKLLVALGLPIRVNDDTWIDITVIKAYCNHAIPDNVDLEDRSQCGCIGVNLDEEIFYKLRDEADDGSAPYRFLAATAYPILRYGHWHSDLEARGLYVPLSQAGNKTVIATNKNKKINYSFNDVDIGHSSYWYNHWQPIHPKSVRSLCGSITTVNQDVLNVLAPLISESTKYFFACKANIITAENSYSEFSEDQILFVV